MKTHKPACLTRFASSAIAAAIAWMAVSLCPAEPAPRGTEFPLMMYAAGNPPGFSAISPYGWNVLQDYGVDTTSKINSHLQACATNGTYGPAPIPMGGTNSDSESSKFEMSPTDTQNWIQAVAGNPGLTWWNMPEEPRNWLRSEIAMLASYSARTRMTDPLRRPNYLAIDTFQTIGQMTAVIPAVDVLGLEIYPEYAYKPHAFVRYYMERGITAIKQAGYTIGTNYLAGQKLPIGIIWVAEDHGVVPTPAQTYHDIWAIIASGGQGVSMYGHWWAVNTNPLLLDCLAQANTAASQINGSEHLGDVILRGTEDPNVGFSILSGPTQTETFTATGGGNESVTLSSLKVLCKVHGGNVYVIAVNSTDQPVTASITNLATNAASATALFQARTVGISSGALTDTFPAWGVNIYKMALNAGSAPAAPTNVTATPQSGSAIALSWQASGGATSYSIKASLNAGGPYVAVATGITGTSHTHLGLSSNTTYYYVVSATNHYGESVNSSQVTGLTQTWTRVNNTSDRILYNAMSLQSGSTGDYQNDNHFGNSADTSAEFTFAGTGVQAIAVKDSSGGNVEVYLDGVLKTTVSCNNATKQQQQVIYTTSGLAGGPHKLKLVRKTNTLRLDAFDVQTASVPMGNNAPVFSSDPIMRPNATVGVAYAATLADSAADVDAGDPLIYAKVSGPAWLSIAGNGTLSGTPAAGNAGANPFTVSVTDAGGHTTQAALNITVASPSNPTWITAPGGSWASAGNWTNGVIAN
ncbi:MAG TPA: putative Ig domain-containing protein, partial [Luteolibacter sp.]